MPNIQYPVKDRMIKVFRLKSIRWANERKSGQFMEKHYLHPRKAYLRAYVRQETANYNADNQMVLPTDRYLFVIGYRKLGKDYANLYIEWRGNVYKLTSPPDEFEGRANGELKLHAQLVPDDGLIYKRISDEEWKR